jgi:hypothetical protein
MSLLIKCVLERYRYYLVDDIIYRLYLIYMDIVYAQFMQDFDRLLKQRYDYSMLTNYMIVAIKNRITHISVIYSRCSICEKSINGDKKIIKTIEIQRMMSYVGILYINYHDDCYKLYMNKLLNI